MAPIPWLGYFSLFLHCDELTPGLDLDMGPKEAQDGKSAVPRQPQTKSHLLGKVDTPYGVRCPLIRSLRVSAITDERSLFLSNDS